MKKISITDFSSGMVQRTAPDDYKPGEVGYMYGFVPEDDQSIRSQWPIQSMGLDNVEGNLGEWITTSSGYDPDSHLVAVYPLRGSDGVFLVALREDGSLWWAKAPASNADYGDTAGVYWTELTGDFGDTNTVTARNQGYDVLADENNQPSIWVERNPDYRFICDVPLEVYKYIKKATSGSQSGRTAHPPYTDFNRDEIPNEDAVDDFGSPASAETAAPRSVVSGVLLHSRRYYDGSGLSRATDIRTKQNVTRAKATGSGPITVRLYVPDNSLYPVTSTVVAKVSVGGVYNSNLSAEAYVTAVGTDVTYGEYIEYSKTTGSAFTEATVTGTVFRRFRTQTAVVAYIDPYANNGEGGVRAITFPNLRRWPTSTDTDVPTFASVYKPIKSIAIGSGRTQLEYAFISKYPYNGGSIQSDISATSTPNLQSAYPKIDHVFHPYTWLDRAKTLKAGTGFIPRGNVGVMWNNQLIIGDIEWRQDSSASYLNEKKLSPVANRAAMATKYSSHGLRDGNTEPHRGYFYYSEASIDEFDPRSVLNVAGTDTRIAGMHYVNNRLISVTTSGGTNDGVITYTGNLSALHPYNPATAANPLAVRKEIVKGGVGTADAPDSYNHGNPQTCLWPEFGQVAFVDKTGYVFVTDGANCSILDDRYPIQGRPVASSVNDHVASVGRHLFIYKDGYLFCYTSINGKGGWSILHRPLPNWDLNLEFPYVAYNVIRSMRGIGTELYFVVHTYAQETDAEGVVVPESEPFLVKSRVMRYALNGPSAERGCQDGVRLPGLVFESPTIGTGSDSVNINWHQVGINFYTEAGCAINGITSVSSYPSGRISPSDRASALEYSLGTMGTDSLTELFVPATITPLQEFDEGFHNFEARTGVGPQKVISTKFSFSGDVKVEGVTFWYSGKFGLTGEE